MGKSFIAVDTGSTINTGTYVITESAAQVHLPRSVLTDNTGTDFGTAANALTITGSTSIVNTPTITGSVSVITNSTFTVFTVTGSTVPYGPAGTPSTNIITVQGSTATNSTAVLITGSTSIVGTPTVTGSVSVINTPTITGSVTSLAASKTQIVDGSGNVVSSSSNALFVNVQNTPTVTGSVSVINTPTITGSVSVINTPTVTGSVSLVNAPGFAVATVNVTGATTNLIVIPSTASNSIYVTSLIISNGLTAGTVVLGQTNVSTAGNILIQTLYFAANGGCVYPIPQQTPIKLSAITPFVATINSSGTMSITATYYVAA